MRRGQSGFTLFEFWVAAAILGVMALVLLERLTYYQEAVEKLHMELTVRALNSALRLEIAKDLMAGRHISMQRLTQANPMQWLERKPANYAGEVAQPEKGRLSAGKWYFDLERKELVYLVGHRRYFRADSAGYNRVRYIVVHAQGQEWPRLVEVEPVRWAIP